MSHGELLGLAVLLYCIGFGCYWTILRQLRTRHAEIWQSLGQPRLNESNLSRSQWALGRFIYGFGFVKLHDARLTVSCIVGMLAAVAFLGVFIGLLASST